VSAAINQSLTKLYVNQVEVQYYVYVRHIPLQHLIISPALQNS